MIATAVAVQMTTPSTVGRSCVIGAVVGEPAEALEVEDRLGDDRAADEQRDVEPEDRHDRRQARAQAVLEDHLPLGEPLCARGADVVLAERLEQVVARQAGVDRHVEHREHDPGQDQVVEPVAEAARERDVPGAAGELPIPGSRSAPSRRRRAPSGRARTPAPRCRRARTPSRVRSIQVRRLTAESTPIATPKMSQIVAAPAISQSVLGARWMISLRTET